MYVANSPLTKRGIASEHSKTFIFLGAFTDKHIIFFEGKYSFYSK